MLYCQSETYGQLYHFDDTEAVVDAISNAAVEYPLHNTGAEYNQGYQDGIRTALAAVGLNGDMFEFVMNNLFT